MRRAGCVRLHGIRDRSILALGIDLETSVGSLDCAAAANEDIACQLTSK
jgi:hypothetical protein